MSRFPPAPVGHTATVDTQHDDERSAPVVPTGRQPTRRRSWSDREGLVETIAARLDKPLTVAGIIFALVVLADTTTTMSPSLRVAFDALGWALWGLFALEFAARMVIAPSTAGFLRRNWWQLLFLAVPFLRFLRPVARLRLPGVGRVISSAVRTSRAATRKLSGRVTWLAALSAIVVLAASQIAYVYGHFTTYGDALHDTALAAITGEPFGQDSGVLQLLEVVLALFSVVVFATLAASLGAYFVERRDERGG